MKGESVTENPMAQYKTRVNWYLGRWKRVKLLKKTIGSVHCIDGDDRGFVVGVLLGFVVVSGDGETVVRRKNLGSDVLAVKVTEKAILTGTARGDVGIYSPVFDNKENMKLKTKLELSSSVEGIDIFDDHLLVTANWER